MVGAFIRLLSQLSATKRRLAIAGCQVCFLCGVSSACVYSETFAALFGTALWFAHTLLSILFFRTRPTRRTIRMKIHRKLRPWKLRWNANRGSYVLRPMRAFSQVDGDCVFVCFAQGLASLGSSVGPRRLRKVAWQSLKKDPVAKEMCGGCMPAAINFAATCLQ